MNFTPNEQQLAIRSWVTANPTNSLNINAYAGTGKSTTLVWLVTDRALVGSTLFLAFNRSASIDLQGKLERHGVQPWTATASTVHAHSLKAWKPLMRNKRRDAINGYKVKDILQDLSRGDERSIYYKYDAFLAKLVSLAKQKALGVLAPYEDKEQWFHIIEHFDLEDDLANKAGYEDDSTYDLDELVEAAQMIYVKSLHMCREKIDFDDMILAPLYFKAKFEQYDNVLLDEAQDTNPARRAVALASLTPKTGRLIAVGDRFQAIYGFTGADSDSMDLIKNELNSHELPLSVTYRCPVNVVNVARTWVPDYSAAPSNPLGPDPRTVTLGAKADDKEATFWKERLTSNDAILCRNTAPLVTLAYMCLRRSIPVYIEGKDIGGGLKQLASKWKVKTLDDLLDKLEDFKERETQHALAKGKQMKAAMIEDKVECLVTLIDACQIDGKNTPGDLRDLITRMFGDTPEGEKPKVTVLSTVHKAKGREWQRVFILGMEKYMPSKWAKKDWEQQQEQNLMYVAVTRSMSDLIYVEVPADFGKKKGN